MLRFLGSLFGGNSNNATEAAQAGQDPNATPREDDGAPSATGDLPADQNQLALFYNYLEAKKDQFNGLITKWDEHAEAIIKHTDTKACSAQHEECLLETNAKAQSAFQLIKEKLKQAFESEDAYFKQKLAETETEVATMKEHIDALIKNCNECEDEQERREAAIHMARAQMYLLREIVDYMQCISQSLKGAVDAEKKLEVVLDVLLNTLTALILKGAPPVRALLGLASGLPMPNFNEAYQNYLDRKSEYEQMGTRLVVDNALAESEKAEQIALAAEKDVAPVSKSSLFKAVTSSSASGQAVSDALDASKNNASNLRVSIGN